MTAVLPAERNRAASGSRLDVAPISRHQEDRAGICLRDRLSGVIDNADNGDHSDRHDQQQCHAPGTERQASTLRRERVKHDNSADLQLYDDARVV